MEHTLECRAFTTARQKGIDDYLKQWPDRCERCHGWGGSSFSYDPSPAGVGLSPGSMYDYDLCPDCVDTNVCPRCGKAEAFPGTSKPQDETCIYCCFDLAKGEGEPPGMEDCGCYDETREDDPFFDERQR